MKFDKTFLVLGAILGSLFALYLIYSHFAYFGDVSFLGGILMLEIVIGCLWKFDERFFPLVMIMFLLAGMNVPMQNAGTSGRWFVLATGAVVGYVIWIKTPRKHFAAFHLIALFCVCAAFVSATVSPFLQMAMFKALSLLLLFLYGCAGARLAVVGRESRFFEGLLWACEIAVYATAICYFVLNLSVWGNPNSLGAAMSIGVFPVLLWGWLASDAGVARWRRLAALLLCAYLVLWRGCWAPRGLALRPGGNGCPPIRGRPPNRSEDRLLRETPRPGQAPRGAPARPSGRLPPRS